MKQHEMTHLQCDTAQTSLNEITVSWVGQAAPSVIEAREQVPDGLAPSQREPTAAPMLWPIVQHVAPLVERLQVPRPVLGWIVVEVSAGEYHSRLVPREGRGQLSGSRQPPQGSAPA